MFVVVCYGDVGRLSNTKAVGMLPSKFGLLHLMIWSGYGPD